MIRQKLDPYTLAASLAELLNSALKCDPAVISSMVLNRLRCNQALADHPSIIVDDPGETPGCFSVGLVGLLNGLLPGCYRVAFEHKDSAVIRFFVVMLGPEDDIRSEVAS